MPNQFNFDDALNEIISSPRARKLAQSTLESMNVDKMSLAELKGYGVELFDALQGAGLTDEERQSAMAINLYVSQKTRELGGVHPSINANDEEGMELMYSNMKFNLDQELIEAQNAGNPAWIKQVTDQINNLVNVDLVRNGDKPVMHFDSDEQRELYETNGARAHQVSESAALLAREQEASTVVTDEVNAR